MLIHHSTLATSPAVNRQVNINWKINKKKSFLLYLAPLSLSLRPLSHSISVSHKNSVFACVCFVLFLFFTYFISIIIMNYSRDQLLVLRPNGGNTICLVMRPRSGKHPKQIGSDASNLITVPITPYNGGFQHLITG